RLVQQVQLVPRAGDQVAVAERLQPTHDRRADHPAMAGDEDALILFPWHGSVLHADRNIVPVLLEQGVTAGDLQVFIDHLGAHLLHADLRRPAQLLLGLARIAQQRLDFRRTEVARIDAHDDVAFLQCRRLVALDAFDDGPLVDTAALEAQAYAQFGRRPANELAHRILHAGGDDEVVG